MARIKFILLPYIKNNMTLVAAHYFFASSWVICSYIIFSPCSAIKIAVGPSAPPIMPMLSESLQAVSIKHSRTDTKHNNFLIYITLN